MPIRALNVGALGRRYCGRLSGSLHALLPEPVDSDVCLAEAGFSAFEDEDDDWDRDFDALVGRLVDDLDARLGRRVVVAPRMPQPRTWWSRLWGLDGRRDVDSLNPNGFDAVAALGLAARHDSGIAFARVEFGGVERGQPEALLFTSSGHPIVWVWLVDALDSAWPEILDAVAGAYAKPEREIDWDSLLPAILRLAPELPRVGLHRGDTASWTDGERCLSFMAGLGVTPPEVYLPSAAAWTTRAPSWAAGRRPEIVADFEAAGVRVVGHDHGWVGGE